ncbi:polysaccharide biosynthesis/export family protein [Carboxylicivirga caseinilyticus]|uniref:polysaccharide biosynthesis/export family protein n=1 Tax=Carboxylicivirga caseinilyticus TaxID=3417572 RepID=UPI002AA90540|nr:polysaccharide biosynthesis/export family protein [uncultured Carboxylicivirga sp.]MCU4166446.1 polysaccharide biosynthesis/export family protein [Marinilabiliaceae bacterium A049]
MRKLFIILLGIVALSCVPQKDIIYLQDNSVTDTLVDYSNINQKIKIKAFDQLYLQVTSLDDGKINFMSNDANRYGGGRSENDLAMVSYVVDDKGYIQLPIIGNFYVLGLNSDEAASKIQKELEMYLNEPTVKVAFVNKNITVLGYVEKPGRYFYATEHINIFQALGMAGDVNVYGNRKYAVVVRDENNKVTKQRIDLTDVDLLGQKAFYLQPNDVVYIEPMNKRKWGIDTFPWALVLSGITTFILVANYIK